MNCCMVKFGFETLRCNGFRVASIAHVPTNCKCAIDEMENIISSIAHDQIWNMQVRLTFLGSKSLGSGSMEV